jgi:hypothetical protein
VPGRESPNLKCLRGHDPANTSCAQHVHRLEGERPLRRKIAPTVSQRQGRHREVGFEGSWRQTCDLRNTNPIRGCEVGRVGEERRSPKQSKAEAVNGARVQGKSMNLPGETCWQAGNGNPGWKARLRQQGSAEAIVPESSRREGPNIKKG